MSNNKNTWTIKIELGDKTHYIDIKKTRILSDQDRLNLKYLFQEIDRYQVKSYEKDTPQFWREDYVTNLLEIKDVLNEFHYIKDSYFFQYFIDKIDAIIEKLNNHQGFYDDDILGKIRNGEPVAMRLLDLKIITDVGN